MSKFQPPAPAQQQQAQQTRPRAATMLLRTLFRELMYCVIGMQDHYLFMCKHKFLIWDVKLLTGRCMIKLACMPRLLVGKAIAER